jgi:putative hydrolase of the HAD superfamily
MIKLVGFDLDNTLYNQELFELPAYKIIAAEIASHYPVNANVIYSQMKNLYHDGIKEKFFDAAMTKCIGILPADWDNFVICKILPLYRGFEVNRTIPLYDNIYSLLEELKKNNKKLVIITNGACQMQKNKLKALNIKNIFDKVYISDQFSPPIRKPDIRIFQKVLSDFQVESDKMVYVGDDIVIDGSCVNCNIRFIHKSNMFSMENYS